jgi:hypothetical protein|tara:strand:+ start:342 stop:482 length:141 start_codon:yes stop_codon:yes gene_type:complete
MIGRHILFPQDIWDKLQALAKLTGNSPSSLVRQFVIDGIRKQKEVK